MNLLIIGPQGSGKGTQGRKLAKELNLEMLEMGAILRDMGEQATPLGQEIRGLLADGHMLSSDLVNRAAGEYLERSGKTDGLLFDAYPRQIAQWEYLKNWMVEHNGKIDCAISLDLSEEESVERLKNRVMSRSTNEIFNYKSLPPAEDWPKEDLVMREDDKPESVRFRLQQYREITLPLLDIYAREGILMRVNGSGTIEEVFSAIIAGLKERGLVD